MTISPGLGVNLKKQFDIRSGDFDISANWITDKELLRTHTMLAGKPTGEALDLCCGTGQNGRALKAQGWNVTGVDISDNMLKIASQYFPVFNGAAEKLPFEDGRFNLVVCRQTFQFLNVHETLCEIARVLVPQGSFILSLTVPFSAEDKDWLQEIHRVKQPLLLKFYTAEDLINELTKANFSIVEKRMVTVRESITQWMQYAPELGQDVKDKVLSMVKDAPLAYKKWHRCEVVQGQVMEDWNWVVLKATFGKKHTREISKKHFIQRAGIYDRSSQWVKDPVLIDKIKSLSDAGAQAHVLDVAVGTGKIAEAFRGHVRCVIGIDACWEMARQAMGRADKIILTPAEKLPFKSNTFDVCVCRQGLQFMELGEVLSEMLRVLKPGGRVVLCHLSAYGLQDKEEAFLIQKLRNPARKNFFLPEDFKKHLKAAGFKQIESFEYLTEESVNQWTDHGAIEKDAKNRIKEAYMNASDDFKRIHQISFLEGDIIDTMKMILVKAQKA